MRCPSINHLYSLQDTSKQSLSTKWSDSDKCRGPADPLHHTIRDKREVYRHTVQSVCVTLCLLPSTVASPISSPGRVKESDSSVFFAETNSLSSIQGLSHGAFLAVLAFLPKQGYQGLSRLGRECAASLACSSF